MDSNPSLDSDIIPDNNSNGVIYIDSYDDSCLCFNILRNFNFIIIKEIIK